MPAGENASIYHSPSITPSSFRQAMRILLFIAFIVSSFAGFCQQGPVQWSVTSKKIKDNQYELLVTGSVEANWYVYAENGTVPELKAIRVETGNDSILPDGAPQPIVSPVTIQETIFHARMKVYQGRVQLRQRIIVKGKAPSFFKITIYAFAANGEERSCLLKQHRK